MILQKENKTKQPISSNRTAVVSNIDILSAGMVKDMYVGVDINYNKVQDLIVKLLSPAGTELILHDQTDHDKPNLQVKYSREVLESFMGEEAKGQWKLEVSSQGSIAEGMLNSWVIGMSCSGEDENPSNIYLRDNIQNGLCSKQYCQLNGLVNGLVLDVFVEHPHTGDLTIDLIAPSGKTVTVHNRKGGDRRNLRASYNRVTLSEMMGEQAMGEWTLKVKDHSPRDLGCLKSWKLNLHVRNNEDLTKIEGVGPAIQQLLYNAGINTYSLLAGRTSTEIKEILTASGGQFLMHDPGTWSQQAHLAALGRWDKLTVLQDGLNGGKA